MPLNLLNKLKIYQTPGNDEHEEPETTGMKRERCEDCAGPGNKHKMPRKYKRKIGAPVRAAWSEEALGKAFGEMDKGQVGVNEISRRYGIPSRTSRRRYAKKSCEKLTLGNAWARAATSSNAVNGFRACGIFPYNPSAIPDSYFAISDNSFQNLDEENLAQDQPVARELDANADVTSYYVEPQPGPSSSTVNSEREPDFGFLLYEDLAADAIIIPLEGNVSPSILSQNHNVETVEVITPGEYYLKECSQVVQNLDEVNLAQDQPVAKELDANADVNSYYVEPQPGPSSSTINREPETVEVITPSKAKKHTPDKPRKNNQKSVPKKKRPRFSSESEQEFDESDSDQTKSDKVNTQCRECFDDYASTKSTADWIQCLMCKLWLHEDCTLYGDYCNRCAQEEACSSKS
ncbi:hypothetical protein HHI36_015767 [Cryptolaemus montrouzieri]|uniref:HTH psq-type domain-containing protein n=1 Tax=Cryptolaemus montrouzieri TaxID=559131 RepID=A0ABD2N7V2_9CUCU